MGGWLSSILSILANALGWGRDVDARKNSPEMLAQKKAQDDEREKARINEIETKAEAGDTAAQEQARKELGE